MKIKVHKSVKLVSLLVISIMSIILAILLIEEYKKENTTVQEKVTYSYIQKSDINYQVSTKPNILYEKNKLPEGQSYLVAFIKDIIANFNIEFSGTTKADLQGEYEISAEVRGYEIQEKEKKVIWTKKFSLVPQQKFKVSELEKAISKEVKIDFLKYDNFAKSVIEASKVNVPVELVVKMKGEMNATTALNEIVKQPIETALVIPLNVSFFSIQKEGVGENKGELKTTETIALPKNIGKIKLYAGLIGVWIVAIIMICVFTESIKEEDIKLKQIKRILNNHGSRMVAVKETIDKVFDETYKVNQIEDLIKIADELEKPIFYINNRDLTKINLFYVMEGNILYLYEVPDIAKKGNTIELSDHQIGNEENEIKQEC